MPRLPRRPKLIDSHRARRLRRRLLRRRMRGVLLAMLILLLPAQAGAWTPQETTIAPGVEVGGVAVGGLDMVQAERAVRAVWSDPPVSVFVAGRTWTENRGALGQILYVRPALREAWQVGRETATVPARTQIELQVALRPAKAERWIASVARATWIAPRSARYRLVKGRPRLIRHRVGRAVKAEVLRRFVSSSLRRPQLNLAAKPARGFVAEVAPQTTLRQLPRVIVIDRSANVLRLYSPRRLLRTFGVATGQPAYPTPIGDFSIVTMQRNPTWTPPNSDWAEGAEPIPPGPGNPLGTRWMGLSAGGVGIHGTPDSASIGYSRSHGCIRMRIPDAERLFSMVSVGTPVHIVR